MTLKQTLASTALMILALTTTTYAEESARSGFWSSLGITVRSENRDTKEGTRTMPSYDPGILGTVTAKSESTLTVTAGKEGTVYTVNALNAKIRMPGKGEAQLSAINVGDVVLVQGTIKGTAIDAVMIVDARMPKGTQMKKDLSGIAGTVTAIAGTTVTVQGKNTVSYTVDADSARVRSAGVENATLADVSIGDTVIVQGTVNNTAVDASAIITIDADTKAELKKEFKSETKGGFFNRMGFFFKSLFKVK